MKEFRTGATIDRVLGREDCPPEVARSILHEETIAVLGYGIQGRGQALNLRDGGVRVIVGQRAGGASYENARTDGWVPGETLFDLEDAAARGTILLYLLSDAGQIELWPTIRPHLTAGKALYFSHGFAIVYGEKTGVIPPLNVDVIMVAPKGSGTTLRRQFLAGGGMNASWAIHQDATGKAQLRCQALGTLIGAFHLYATTFARETIADLVGERGTIMGAIYGLWLAQYEVLREHGFTPAEAFNDSVEECTQSLYPLIGENGMDWMYSHCSTTAQRGALDWYKPFRDAVKPVFEKLFQEVASGAEAARAIDSNRRADYRKQLDEELSAIRDHEMWRVGAWVRTLRPECATRGLPGMDG